MTRTELDDYQQTLLGLRERLRGDVSHLTGEAFRQGNDETGGNLSHIPIHMADLGTDTFEQENTLNLLANEQECLAEITGALQRIQDGTFGRCEECQGEITRTRLKELPYTRFCIQCARKHERRS